MLKKFVFTLFVCILFCHTVAKASPLDSVRLEMRGVKKFIIHRVVKGDALASLSARYAVNEAEILSNNPLIIEKVYPGQLVKIPINEAKYGAVTVPPVKSLTPSKLPLAKTLPAPSAITVKETPKTEAINDNVLVDLPPSKEELNSKDYKIYVVASPQTVNQLAASFAVEPEHIIELNKLKNYNLKEGQKVKIPNHKMHPAPMLSEAKNDTIILPEPKLVVAQTPETKKESVIGAKNELTETVVPKPEPKIEAKPEPKIVAKVEPTVETKIEPSNVLENKLAKVTTKKEEVSNANASPLLAKTQGKKVEVVLNQDSLNLLALQKRRSMEQFMKMDSAYIHPKGIAYKPFDYKESNYNYDLYSTLLAEENAIVVPTTNQSSGVGDMLKTHVVKKDETIQQVAKKYKVSVTDIINWNGLLTYRVRAGQELVVNAARADVSPYVRTLPKQAMKQQSEAGEDIVGFEKVAGLAKYNEKQAFTRGVYTNAAEKGKFVYIVNRDNFKEHFARVLGPLPKDTPKDIVVILDPQSAEHLGISKSMMRVYVYFGVVNAATEAKN